VACVTVRTATPVAEVTVGNLSVVCLDPCVKDTEEGVEAA
jgi:hypothetical protein